MMTTPTFMAMSFLQFLYLVSWLLIGLAFAAIFMFVGAL